MPELFALRVVNVFILGAVYAITVMLLVVLAVRPRLSVTVTETLDVPLFLRTPDVNDAFEH